MSLTTADRWSDEMNTRRVLLERTPVPEHISMMHDTLGLQIVDIAARYLIAGNLVKEDGIVTAAVFVDGSTATRHPTNGRWSTP